MVVMSCGMSLTSALLGGCWVTLAEGARFELAVGCPTTVFKNRRLDLNTNRGRPDRVPNGFFSVVVLLLLKKS
jgi:hypothetical protein